MLPQSSRIKWCKLTLVTFVWLFSTVHFQMYPQTACVRGYKLTLVAFVWISTLASICHTHICFYIQKFAHTIIKMKQVRGREKMDARPQHYSCPLGTDSVKLYKTEYLPDIIWKKESELHLGVISSDRSSYSDSVLVEIRANFLRFWTFLPKYKVFLFEIWMQIAAIAAFLVSFCRSVPPEFLRSFLRVIKS